MLVCLGSSAVESGEETSVCSEYSAGTVTETFLSSKTEPQRLLSLSPGDCCQFFRTEEFYLLGRRQGFCSRASSLDELSANRMSAQPRVRNDIPRSTQKISWKNGKIPSLSWNEKPGLPG